MDLFLSFISRLISGFFIAHILYIIFQRRPKVPMVVLLVLIGMETLTLIRLWLNAEAFVTILLQGMLNVLPYVFAYMLFQKVTGQRVIGFKRIKRQKLKPISYDVETIHKDRLISLVGVQAALVIGAFVIFLMDGFFQILLGVISAVVLALSGYLFYRIRLIRHERVIVIIGKDRSLLYTYEIDPKALKVKVETFFKNPNYIIDPIGIAILKHHDGTVERDHLYWIATSDQVDVSKEPLKAIQTLSYQNHLDVYQKYHYRIVTFNVSKMMHASIEKTETIR
ncbi:MAG: hypothetical protein K9K93_00210 [Acholeplasmataceae bacterium]|nr:hypothetical protein [Acholeplasmataceae bacterium]